MSYECREFEFIVHHSTIDRTSMAAAARAAASTAEDLLMRRHSAAFESLGDKAIHRLQHTLQLLLGIGKSTDRGMAISLRLQGLKARQITFLNLLALVLAALEIAAQVHDFAIQRDGSLVGQKGLGAIAC